MASAPVPAAVPAAPAKKQTPLSSSYEKSRCVENFRQNFVVSKETETTEEDTTRRAKLYDGVGMKHTSILSDASFNLSRDLMVLDLKDDIADAIFCVKVNSEKNARFLPLTWLVPKLKDKFPFTESIATATSLGPFPLRPKLAQALYTVAFGAKKNKRPRPSHAPAGAAPAVAKKASKKKENAAPSGDNADDSGDDDDGDEDDDDDTSSDTDAQAIQHNQRSRMGQDGVVNDEEADVPLLDQLIARQQKDWPQDAPMPLIEVVKFAALGCCKQPEYYQNRKAMLPPEKRPAEEWAACFSEDGGVRPVDLQPNVVLAVVMTAPSELLLSAEHLHAKKITDLRSRLASAQVQLDKTTKRLEEMTGANANLAKQLDEKNNELEDLNDRVLQMRVLQEAPKAKPAAKGAPDLMGAIFMNHTRSE